MQSIPFPYPGFMLKLARQSAVVWLLLRLLFFVLLWLAGGTSAALHPSLVTRIFIVSATVLLVWWDRRRAHELLLPANLGAWSGWFWAAALLVAATLDLATQTLIEAL